MSIRGGSGVNLYYLDHVLNSQSEMNDRMEKGWRRTCRLFVSARSTVPNEVKVKLSSCFGKVVYCSVNLHLMGGNVVAPLAGARSHPSLGP